LYNIQQYDCILINIIDYFSKQLLLINIFKNLS